MPRRSNGSVVLPGPVGHRRSQLNSKWSSRPFITAGKTTNSDSSIATPIARIDNPADSGWFLRVTKTIRTNAASGNSRMVKAVVITSSALHQVELIDLDRPPLAIHG